MSVGGAAGSRGSSVPPSAAPPRGPAGEAGWPSFHPTSFPQTHSEFDFFSAPIPWCAPFWNILSTRKGRAMENVVVCVRWAEKLQCLC